MSPVFLLSLHDLNVKKANRLYWERKHTVTKRPPHLNYQFTSMSVTYISNWKDERDMAPGSDWNVAFVTWALERKKSDQLILSLSHFKPFDPLIVHDLSHMLQGNSDTVKHFICWHQSGIKNSFFTEKSFLLPLIVNRYYVTAWQSTFLCSLKHEQWEMTLISWGCLSNCRFYSWV